MSDSTITPIGVATSAVAGAAAVAGTNAIAKFAKAKYTQAAEDSFLKKSAKTIGEKVQAAKNRVPKSIKDAYHAAGDKLGALKGYIVGKVAAFKATTFGTKIANFLDKPFMKSIGNFVKKPIVAGAIIGVAAYLIVGKIIDKIKNQ